MALSTVTFSRLITTHFLFYWPVASNLGTNRAAVALDVAPSDFFERQT